MPYFYRYNPCENRDFLIASGLITPSSDIKSGEIWQTAHLLTTTAAAYCSEHRLHPTWVCAWFGSKQPSECYSEAAMLGSMALVETWNKRGGRS